MNISLPQVITGAVGALLIFAAVRNQSPVTIVKDALNGKVTAAKAKDGKMSTVIPGLGLPGEDPNDPDGGLGEPWTEDAPLSDGPVGFDFDFPTVYKNPLPRNYQIVTP